jgi:hypothetical protein
MHKIATFVMSKKFIPVFIALTALGIFFTYQSIGRNENEDPKARHQKILNNVGILLEQGHSQPPKN